MEDLNLYLKDVLTERPHTRVPSADTVLRGIEELATENMSYTAEKTGNIYDFNTAEKLNQLLIKLLLATRQLTEGGEYDVDFDHQFLEAEKYDSKRTYKGFDGYSPGVFTIGGLIVYLENRDGNANVRFMQAETHRRFFNRGRFFDPKATLRAEDRRRTPRELKWMELTVKQRIRGRFFDPTVSIATHRGEDGKSINHSWTCTIWNELIL